MPGRTGRGSEDHRVAFTRGGKFISMILVSFQKLARKEFLLGWEKKSLSGSGNIHYLFFNHYHFEIVVFVPGVFSFPLICSIIL